jgi:hypothetical protein
VTGAYFRDRTGTCGCLVPGCNWRHQIDPNQGLSPEESVEAAHTLLARHRETSHPYLQLQVQKCPLRGCAWEDSDWSTPGVPYRQSTRRLQKNWSKHMTTEHPTVRGPGTIQVVMELYPPDSPSSDGREIASGALHDLPEDGVPIVSARGEIVGRVSELREENGWAIAEGFLREDLINPREAESLWRGRTLPVSFAVDPDPYTVQGDRPLYVRAARLRNVRVEEADVTVWEGTGMRALHPRPEANLEPPAVGETRSVAQSIDDAAIKAAMMSLDTALRPVRDALEEWVRVMAPAVQAAAQALVEISRNIQKPQPMVIRVAQADADFLEERAAPVSRYTCTCGGMPVPHVPGGPNCLQRPPGEWAMDPQSRPLDYAPEAGRIVPGPGFEDRIRTMSETVLTGREGWTDRQRRAEYAVTPVTHHEGDGCTESGEGFPEHEVSTRNPETQEPPEAQG